MENRARDGEQGAEDGEEGIEMEERGQGWGIGDGTDGGGDRHKGWGRRWRTGMVG